MMPIIIKILKKKKLSLLVILFTAFLLAALYSNPILSKCNSILSLLDPLFSEQTPVIYLRTDGLSFDRPVPYEISLDNGIRIFFAEKFDSTAFVSAQNYSVFIAQDKILCKNRDKIKSISLESIEVDKDYMEIDPVKVGRFLHKFSSALLITTGLVLFLSLFIILYIIALLAGGLGIMIDAFSNGPYTFAILFNGAGLLLLIDVLIWMLSGLSSLKHFQYGLISYYMIYLVLVYWTIRSSKRNDFV